MLKYIFAFIIILHGLIHFMGFAKAYDPGYIKKNGRSISKISGLIWGLNALLFTVAAVLFLLGKEGWPVIGISACFISQILIVMAWRDAKYGTIANIVILLVAIPVLANVQFNKMVKKEVAGLLSQPQKMKTIITKEMLDSLPPIVQKWLKNAGIIGKENIQFVRLKQKGEMRTESDGKWLPLEAVQYFSVNEPQFIWQTKVLLMPSITITGRDKFVNGNGEVLIKFLSLINVSNTGGDDKINSAAMVRYLAETTWFPTAALSSYINWESINTTTAKAIMKYKGLSVSGIMKFAGNGDLLSFEADRYKGKGRDASLEKWLVEITGYKDFGGLRIPYKNKVTWKLRTGDFNWANVELTDLEFNKQQAY